MGISANTLFHFTSSDSLKKILISNVFFANYSLERFDDILPHSSIYQSAYIPLVCFCDLTITQISQISRHTNDFGKYGIGLKKDWGERKGVSPVVYVHKKSYPSKSIYSLIKTFASVSKSIQKQKSSLEEPPSSEEKIYADIRARLVDFFKYIKPYKGFWQKNKKQSEEIKYYDEREWRYCPTQKRFKVFSGKYNRNELLTSKLNKYLRKNSQLKFTADDIKYIIIDKRSEIQDFFEAIDAIDISQEKRNELKTRIITFDEIKEDF